MIAVNKEFTKFDKTDTVFERHKYEILKTALVNNLTYDHKYLQLCSQEEADTGVFLHIRNISSEHLQSEFLAQNNI